MKAQTKAEARPLNVTDICDRCNGMVQAYVLVILNGGGELHFCIHHANVVQEKLEPQCSVWSDQSYLLHDTPVVIEDD